MPRRQTTGTTAAPPAVRRVWALLAFALLMFALVYSAGCSGDAGEPATTTATSATTTTSATSTTSTTSSIPTTVTSTLPGESGKGLTLEQARNAEITGTFDQTVMSFTLVDGSYSGPRSGDDPSPVTATISDTVALGDLNGDQTDDAAIALTITSDTEASQFIVVLVAKGGEPVSGGSHPVDAGSRIDGMSIAEGEIFVEAMVPGPEDPQGQPTVPITATYRLPLAEGTGWSLLHASQTSQTPAGDVREITITYPEPGASLSFVALIKGTVTIAPFENNLVYRVFDSEMVQRAEGPVTVDAPDLGAPGTFELPLGLIDMGCTGWVTVTISDLSAADGSILAMDSIELQVFAAG